jgi:hypothetical protein
MRKPCMALATLCALTTPASLAAAERAEFQISPRAGRGILKLDQFRNVDERLAARACVRATMNSATRARSPSS